jgi:hypothetical protein
MPSPSDYSYYSNVNPFDLMPMPNSRDSAETLGNLVLNTPRLNTDPANADMEEEQLFRMTVDKWI